MTPRLLTLLAFLCLSCATTTEGPEPEPREPSSAASDGDVLVVPTPDSLDRGVWNVGSGEHGHFALAWRPVGGRVPRNEPFELEVLVFRDGELVTPQAVLVRGWMPDHGHGFVRDPLTTVLGDGRLGVEGMLFHMRGFWQLFFDLHDGSTSDVVAFELTIR